MKKLYTALFALGLAFGANAQNYTYQLDSLFNGNGIRVTSESPNSAMHMACYLNDDNSSFVVGELGTSVANAHYLYGAKFKPNGTIDSVLCNSICVSGVPVGGSNFDIHQLQNNFYVANSGYGGSAMFGLNPSTMDVQSYDPDGKAMTCSAKINDSVIVEAGGTELYTYKVNPLGSGYYGFTGYYGSTHGGNITLPGTTNTIQAIGVQSDKKIIIAGTYQNGTNYDVFVARLKVGLLQLDSTFGTNGIFGIVGVTQANTNKVFSLTIGTNDTIYTTYKVGIGGFSYYASINPNGGFNTNYTGGSTFAGQLPGFANAETIMLDNNKLFVTANISSLGQIFNSNGSFYSDLPNLSSSLPNFSNYNLEDVKKNINGDLLLVGSVDSNSIKRGIIVKLKKVTVTPASISNTLKATAIQVYPNPATNSILFNVENVSKNATASIFSIDGKLVATQAINNAKTEMNISSITKGMYVLQIKNGEQLLTSKFIKE